MVGVGEMLAVVVGILFVVRAGNSVVEEGFVEAEYVAECFEEEYLVAGEYLEE